MGKKKDLHEPASGLDLSYTQNRELSWLQFNLRVLEEAEDRRVPLFERLKFVSIFESNLTEFFMIRVGSLSDLAAITAKDRPDTKCGWTAAEQMDRIFRFCRPLYEKKDAVMRELEQELAAFGVQRVTRKQMTAADRRAADRWYKEQSAPILSPQVIDPHHPFPHVTGGQLHIILRLKGEDRTLLGVLPIPQSLPPFVRLPGDGVRYVLTEELIAGKVASLFEGLHVAGKSIIRVTRNADITPDDEALEIAGDYRQMMKKLLKQRGRLAPVRLEYQGRLSKPLQSQLCVRLHLFDDQVFRSETPLALHYVLALENELPKMAGLRYAPWQPQPSAQLIPNRPVLPQVLQHDVLLHYPYESMSPFLQLVREAAVDPQVATIKITIYRLARQSRLISYLCQAAENGKDVTVLIELRARFDEQNNIDWAERLQEAGCMVLYGVDESDQGEAYKVHAKVCLITRAGRQGVETITQIGTGNYNERTAAQYTDFCLLTANPEIGEDAVRFFDEIALGAAPRGCKRLLVAPHGFKTRILEEIDRQIARAKEGRPCRILMKLNSLTDREIIDRLAAASCAGVPVDLIVRGICCLVPGVPEKTENIRICSVVGRFLEHARAYCFGAGEGQRLYIGSADLMTRNTEKRVEVACPVYDRTIAAQILEILELQLRDTAKARVWDRYGQMLPPKQTADEPALDSQQELMRRAAQM